MSGDRQIVRQADWLRDTQNSQQKSGRGALQEQTQLFREGDLQGIVQASKL